MMQTKTWGVKELTVPVKGTVSLWLSRQNKGQSMKIFYMWRYQHSLFGPCSHQECSRNIFVGCVVCPSILWVMVNQFVRQILKDNSGIGWVLLVVPLCKGLDHTRSHWEWMKPWCHKFVLKKVHPWWTLPSSLKPCHKIVLEITFGWWWLINLFGPVEFYGCRCRN